MVSVIVTSYLSNLSTLAHHTQESANTANTRVSPNHCHSALHSGQIRGSMYIMIANNATFAPSKLNIVLVIIPQGLKLRI